MNARRFAQQIALAAAPALLAGCVDSQSVLNPQSGEAHDLARLFWIFTTVCSLVWVLVVAALLTLLLRRRRPDSTPETDNLEQQSRKTAVVAGLVALTAVILVLFTLGSFYTTRGLIAPGPHPLLIKVTGAQWWWQVEYEDSDPTQVFSTANEIHIPVGRPVTFDLEATDVIHSFWAPNLMGKQDLIPGHRNSLTLTADKPGEYRGQCAEFCGLQHSHMAFLVVAQTPAEFWAWRQAQLKPAAPPASGQQALGQHLFVEGSCATCHTISGAGAGGKTGPDLTHFGSRSTIAAGLMANTPSNLAAWIKDPQELKPGVNMPQVPLSDHDRGAIVAYLEALK
ncbi:MAG TPA: cytochrome c oxidase subunit II [Caulobacteraceae bacterium]|jgi:cytochrome c oxidase subunit 2|nr:cytochrome c oxidase subunit II [Caulobacteraceae bacterium]